MYTILYKYGSNTKVAYVRALSASDAETILLEQFLVGAIQIVSVMEMSMGAVIYPDGRH